MYGIFLSQKFSVFANLIQNQCKEVFLNTSFFPPSLFFNVKIQEEFLQQIFS